QNQESHADAKAEDTAKESANFRSNRGAIARRHKSGRFVADLKVTANDRKVAHVKAFRVQAANRAFDGVRVMKDGEGDSRSAMIRATWHSSVLPRTGPGIFSRM